MAPRHCKGKNGVACVFNMQSRGSPACARRSSISCVFCSHSDLHDVLAKKNGMVVVQSNLCKLKSLDRNIYELALANIPEVLRGPLNEKAQMATDAVAREPAPSRALFRARLSNEGQSCFLNALLHCLVAGNILPNGEVLSAMETLPSSTASEMRLKSCVRLLPWRFVLEEWGFGWEHQRDPLDVLDRLLELCPSMAARVGLRESSTLSCTCGKAERPAVGGVSEVINPVIISLGDGPSSLAELLAAPFAREEVEAAEMIMECPSCRESRAQTSWMVHHIDQCRPVLLVQPRRHPHTTEDDGRR